MSLVPENWIEIAKGDEDGVPTVIVAREKLDGSPTPRITSWKLQWLRGDWRIRQIFFSTPNPGLDGQPTRLKDYRAGIKLSDNAIDRRLREFCNVA